MAMSLDKFAEEIVASGILPAADVSAHRNRHSPTDAERFARLLVKQKALTAYQAQQVYAGKAKALVLGNYLILDKLGQGGMGMVLKARHRRMDRIVALKVLSPTVVKTPDLLARFQREVEAAGRLEHQNIVSAFDADEANGTHFFVMQYIEGADLSALVKNNGPLPIDQVLHCITQAARGLEFAHRHGVIHRDIKPANLLLDGHGTVKILDMGLARIEGETGANAELTSTGTVMGTVDYMAPEQAVSTKSADARSDIYSLGITLWYLLTGRPAYEGDSLMARLMAHANSPIPSLKGVRGQIPDALDAVFQKMVAKAPADRFQTMTQVIAALDACQRVGAKTTAAPSVSAGPSEDSKLSDFLGVFNANTDALVETVSPSLARKPTVKVAKSPGGEFEKTVTSARNDVGTDPDTVTALRNRGLDRKFGQHSKQTWWQDRRVQIGGGAAAMLLLGTIIFNITSTEGTQAPVTDPGDAKSVEAIQYGQSLVPGEATPKPIVQTNGTGMRPPGRSADRDVLGKDRGFDPVAAGPPPQGAANGGVIDLLAAIELPRDALKHTTFGEWTREGGALLSPGSGKAGRIQIRHEPPLEYEVSAVVQRVAGSDGVMFGVIVDGHRAEVGLDVFSPRISALSLIDNRPADANETTFREPVLADRKPHTIRITVGLRSVRAKVDGRDVVRWEGDPARLTAPTTVPNPKHLWIGAAYDQFRFLKMELRPLPPPDHPVAGASRLDDPAFRKWMAEVEALPPEKQLEEVSRKLVELNPKFDGKLEGQHGNGPPAIRNGAVATLRFYTDHVTDISPVAVLKALEILQIPRSSAGSFTGALDLTPLRGLKLINFDGFAADIASLEPLRGMPLSYLYLHDTRITDLAPLTGMPLQQLWCQNSLVTDVKPLEQCSGLKELNITAAPVTPESLGRLRRALPQCKIKSAD